MAIVPANRDAASACPGSVRLTPLKAGSEQSTSPVTRPAGDDRDLPAATQGAPRWPRPRARDPANGSLGGGVRAPPEEGAVIYGTRIER